MNTAALWLACALAGLANPPSPAVPLVLVDAPIAARIAANDTAHWKALGASGFLFSGIYDDLRAAPQGGLQDLGPTSPESSLLKELRLSVDDLQEAGLSHNFLRVAFGPDAPWFSDRDRAREAVAFFQGAGLFCQRAGLKGIALDLRPQSPIYRYAWSKYDPDQMSSTRLAESARDLGRRGMRAFIRELPDADLIFIADTIDGAGPLWYAFFEGLIESVGAANSIRLDLAVRVPAEAESFDAITAFLEDLEAHLCAAMGEDARQIWQRQGGYIPLLEPLHEKEGKRSIALSPEAWRTRIAAAKLAASDYVAVRGDYGTWWQLSAKQAQGYAKLRQRPIDPPRATPTPLAEGASWDFTTPFDALQRVGPHSDQRDAPYCFVDGPRAAVFFWKAPPAPLLPDDGASALLSTPLATRKPETLAPEDGQITPGRVSPVSLIAGLPLAPWAGPAALWCAFDAVPAVGLSRVPLRLGMRNIFPGDVTGVIEVKTPDTLSLGVTEFPILLRAGESAVFERNLQGRFALGEPLRLTLALRTPSASGIERSFRATPHLATRWQHQRDGSIVTPPLLMPGEAPVIVVASREGDVAGYQADAAPIWQRRYASPLQITPWPGRSASGTACLAIADAKGTIRAMGSRSEPLWEARIDTPPTSVLFANLFALEADCLIAATGTGALVCFAPDGQESWRSPAEDAPLLVCTPAQQRQFARTLAPMPDEDRLYLAIGGDTPRLRRLGGHGAALWSRDLPAAPTLAPVYLPASATQPARVAVPMANGEIAFFSADIGALLATIKHGLADTWRVFVPIEFDSSQEGPEMLVLHGSQASLLDAQGNSLWTAGEIRAQHIGMLPEARGAAVLLLGSGQLTALGQGGRVLWQDRPPTQPRALAARALDTPTPGMIFVGTGEGFVQALDLPPAR